jgi:hypothetical protein
MGVTLTVNHHCQHSLLNQSSAKLTIGPSAEPIMAKAAFSNPINDLRDKTVLI